MPQIDLVGLFPHAMTVHRPASEGGDLRLEPGPGGSFVPYLVRDLPEAGLHGFIRLAPLLGVAMAQTAFPPQDMERLVSVVNLLVRSLQDGRLSGEEVGEIVAALFLQQGPAQDKIRRVVATIAKAAEDGRFTAAEVKDILWAAAL